MPSDFLETKTGALVLQRSLDQGVTCDAQKGLFHETSKRGLVSSFVETSGFSSFKKGPSNAFQRPFLELWPSLFYQRCSALEALKESLLGLCGASRGSLPRVGFRLPARGRSDGSGGSLSLLFWSSRSRSTSLTYLGRSTLRGSVTCARVTGHVVPRLTSSKHVVLECGRVSFVCPALHLRLKIRNPSQLHNSSARGLPTWMSTGIPTAFHV